jgi:hypothetical protein
MPLLKEEFVMLYETQLPLIPEEKNRIQEEYFDLYALFVTNEIDPAQAFEATKMIFYSQEQQIKERIK